MTFYVLRDLRAPHGRLPDAVLGAYAAIMVCSALWLPLTCAMLERPEPLLWWTIRADLGVVAIGSLAVLGLILRDKPRSVTPSWIAAAAGATAFCLQTAALDAIVWPAYFFRGS
jgi:hypothetical protein